ncbi:uncharacterized protein BO96DRAFT_463380 [Aspergillus niger CBS 101883]|uniref:uncharacterized protein n=1 Tax=Aspergillus lacticoffeatus (strain CBS 101883) TaxID=1450533 RepID=UPI000D7ED7D2|nr:uncharacterized protein BO96DRAFT_463380 [Aspergillus niger CBS 101883]PYH59853.1 hypothetical protein BO96DRAFT_463380 [Aspergillus niger CBS 101883]
MMEQAPIQAQSLSLLNSKRTNTRDATILHRVHAIGQTRIRQPLRPYRGLGLSFSLYHTQSPIGGAAGSGSCDKLANLLRLANRTDGSDGKISFRILSSESFLEVFIVRKCGEDHL